MWTAIAYIGAALLGALGTYAATRQSNKTSQEISNQNIEFQEEENEITRAREDNAMQRAAADYKAAGLSQTLAAGNPASAAALTAPQASYQNESAIGRSIEKANLKETVLALKDHQAQIKKTEAEIDNIKAQTEASNLANSVYMQRWANEQKLNDAQVAVMKSQVKVYDSQEKLNSIEGEYRAKQLDQQIKNLVSEYSLKNMSLYKMEEEIYEIIARTNKLDKETSVVIQDLINAQLEADKLNHDIEYAELYNLPVGEQVGGMFGSGLNVFRSFFENGNTQFSPELWQYQLDHPRDYGSSGGYAW